MKKNILLCSAVLLVSCQLSGMGAITKSAEYELDQILQENTLMQEDTITHWSPVTLNYLQSADPCNIAIEHCVTEAEKDFYNQPDNKRRIRDAIIGCLNAIKHNDNDKTNITVSIDARQLTVLPTWQQHKAKEASDPDSKALLAGFTLLLKTPAQNITFLNLPRTLKHKMATVEQKEKLRQALLASGSAITELLSGTDGQVHQEIAIDWDKLISLPHCKQPQPSTMQKLLRPASYVATAASCALIGYLFAQYRMDV